MDVRLDGHLDRIDADQGEGCRTREHVRKLGLLPSGVVADPKKFRSKP
jgi:hypothetical protein